MFVLKLLKKSLFIKNIKIKYNNILNYWFEVDIKFVVILEVCDNIYKVYLKLMI